MRVRRRLWKHSAYSRCSHSTSLVVLCGHGHPSHTWLQKCLELALVVVRSQPPSILAEIRLGGVGRWRIRALPRQLFRSLNCLTRSAVVMAGLFGFGSQFPMCFSWAYFDISTQRKHFHAMLHNVNVAQLTRWQCITVEQFFSFQNDTSITHLARSFAEVRLPEYSSARWNGAIFIPIWSCLAAYLWFMGSRAWQQTTLCFLHY